MSLEPRIRERIRDVPDFPKPGIVFKDITPVLGDGPLLRDIVAFFAERCGGRGIDVVAGIESRGFIFAAPLAVALGAAFTPIRKPGKLPHRTMRVDYELEYGTDALEAHIDGVLAGQRVLLIDDVLATGGTAAGAVRLIRQLGGEVVAAEFLIELGFLSGRSRLSDVATHAVVRY